MREYTTVANIIPLLLLTISVLLLEAPMAVLYILIGTPTVGSTVKSRAGTRSNAIGINGQAAAQAVAIGSAAAGLERLQTISK